MIDTDAELEADELYQVLTMRLVRDVASQPAAIPVAERYTKGLARWHESLVSIAFLAANRVAADLATDFDHDHDDGGRA